MSYNISKDLVAVMSNLTTTIDLNHLGPRQRKQFDEGLATGVLKTNTLQSRLATEIRRNLQLPTLHWDGRTLDGRGVPTNHPFFESLKVWVIKAKLNGDYDKVQWADYSGSYFTPERLIDCQAPDFYLHVSWAFSGTIKFTAADFKGLSFGAAPAPDGNLITLDLTKEAKRANYLR